ncbi:hypothetical protein CWC46_19880 [Prodigiosinella confusarubida]|uniref:Uncharacterized protein n=1 Tax=Serratia sp. (strain ATCC 39006) TaxID=104623 RepID=A0A2I5TNN7_SERS3|nr:hypothetical protein [Serratia sp. ATCC 39006]AUH01861.1 hypothetical protein CWC46_19880 [Serratia sp. ATCC 39006]AUH06184.1 hypothetical protein Ser39006_019880 [Serratia sp. ATCC 39006]
MITHTRFTIADSYALLGSLRVPGVRGKFEVRAFNDRVKRPRLIVVHENWHEATRRERIAPLVVVQFEEDGRKKYIEQKEETPFKSVDLADLSRRAVEFFQRNEHCTLACHH